MNDTAMMYKDTIHHCCIYVRMYHCCIMYPYVREEGNSFAKYVYHVQYNIVLYRSSSSYVSPVRKIMQSVHNHEVTG